MELQVGDFVKDTRDEHAVRGKILAITERSLLIRFGQDDAIYERDEAQFLEATTDG